MNTRAANRIAHATLVTIACLFACPVGAQPPQPPTLDQILQHLEANLRHYEKTVPSFYCDERVYSSMSASALPTQTVTDSTFRLKHSPHPNGTITLEESRDVKKVNGRPSTATELGGPSVVSGAFSGGLAIVSINQQSCMTYKLHPIRHPKDPYVVEFSSFGRHTFAANCILKEGGSGRVIIEPATMQVKRMELDAPQHELFFDTSPDGSHSPPVVGEWVISVSYSPTPLGAETFWLPRDIESVITVRSEQARSGHTNFGTWNFDAHYRNYHKLEVTSRILPADPTP
jgi:hypothetical protein